MRTLKSFGLGLILIGSAFAHGADPEAYLAVGGDTLMPYGWEDFCSRQPQECRVEPLAPQEIPYTVDNLLLLDQINREVNKEIDPVTNMDHWHTMLDHWDYPTPKDMRGDCKIYALWKRKKLLEKGFPRQALLMLIVKDLHGDGHTILNIKTDKGDFILDNMNDEIKRWDETGYRYVKRQSENDPNIWLSVGPPQPNLKPSKFAPKQKHDHAKHSSTRFTREQ